MATPARGREHHPAAGAPVGIDIQYLVKEGYARLIKFATRRLPEAPTQHQAVILDRLPPANPAHPDFKVLEIPGNGVIATIPRYEAFTDYSRWLAAEGISFRRNRRQSC